MKAHSLKARVGICIVVLTAIIVIVLSSVAYHEFKEGLFKSMDLILQSDLQQARGLLFSNAASGADTRRELLNILNSQATFGSSEYQLWLEHGTDKPMEILFSTDLFDEFTRQSPAIPPLNKFIHLNLDQGNKTYRAIWARYQMPDNGNFSGRTVNIALAISSRYAFHEAGEFVRVLIIAGCIVVWAAWGITNQILRWALKPIDSLADQMGHIREADLTRIKRDYSTPHQELLPFVESWEGMLGRLAESAEEQKRFISDAAHELKTPIAVMKSTFQLAQSKKRDVDYYEAMTNRALEDVDRLHHLVNQLLDLSRIESTGAFAAREKIDLRELIEEAIDYHQPCLEENNFHLNARLCSAEIIASRDHICRLLNNLIENAIQYAPPATTITVTLEREETSVRIVVHDEGGSIPPEECSQLFNRFYRVGKARDRNSGGSGLGLAIVKEIVSQHSGRIWVESDREKGTRFIVILPEVSGKQ